MSKAILLVRVSTERQDFDEQELNLYNMALADGFKDDDIIPICEKESGIKLSEEERSGLKRMREVIETEDVAVVYASEASRIARKKKISFSVTDFLIEHNVNLIIHTPYIRLMNPDGSVNEGMEMAFTFAAQMAESEMRIKKARWHRTHVKNSREGKWNGGHPVRFGYKLDPNNYYIIDEEQAEIVHRAFEIYTTTNCGTTAVTRELQKLGYDVNYNMVARMLTCEHYTGKLLKSKYHVKNENGQGWKKIEGLDLKYPAIISEETFAEAQRRRISNNVNAYKRNSYYFARGLMRCPTCGAIFTASSANGWYVCSNNQMSNHALDRCKDNTTIGINVLDTILWDATVSEFIKDSRKTHEERVREAAEKIEECRKILSATVDRLGKTETKAKRYAFLFGEGDITEDDYKKRKAQILSERSRIESDKVSAQERIRQYQKVIEGRDESNMISQLMALSEEAFSINELKEMCELVHLYINRVELSRDDTRNRFITVFAVSGETYKYKTRYAGSAGHKYYREADMIIMESLSPWVEFTPNIIIKRKTGHLRKDNRMTEPFIIIKNDGLDYNVQNSID